MRRDEAMQRLESIEGPPEQRLSAYAALAAELECSARTPGELPPWKVHAVETFVEILLRNAADELPPAVSKATRSRVRRAVLQGPGAIEALGKDLEEALRQADQPQQDLEILQGRRHALLLRKRCLEHLRTLFDAERTQP